VSAAEAGALDPRTFICVLCRHPVTEGDLHGASTEMYPFCADIGTCNGRIFEGRKRERAAEEAAAAEGDKNAAPAVAADPGHGEDAPAAGAGPSEGEQEPEA
jgi:hypothetical protein